MSAVVKIPDLLTARVPCSSAETVASLDHVTKRFPNGVIALDNLSLNLRRGEVVALLGPNGAGKSTAVRLLMGLSAPTCGSASIFGADPRNHEARLRTGVMLQVGRAPEMLQVREHIELFRGYYPSPMEYGDIIDVAGLEGIESRMFANCWRPKAESSVCDGAGRRSGPYLSRRTDGWTRRKIPPRYVGAD